MPEESRLEKVEFDRVRRAVRAAHVGLAEFGQLAEGDLPGGGAAGGSRELAPYLALLVLALLAAESFLANRFYRTASPPGERQD